MISVIASIKVKESCLGEFLEILKANISKVLNETGCIEYAPTIDFKTELAPQILEANTVTIIEKWETFENLQAHLTAPHMLDYKSRVKDLVEGVSFKVLKYV